ncbi:MAG: hypothetical protein K2M34_00735 [Alphaproteobacteria bacterium]|nr:hypothetical protein [Alphaproteobacteria bacterium]
MNLTEAIRLYFNYPDAPTKYQLEILHRAVTSAYFKSEPEFVIKAAYNTLCSRQYLPRPLEHFLPRNIKTYSIDTTHLFPRPDKEFIREYITQVIEPDFDKIQGCFFKLGGMSAKTKSRTRANSIDNIYDAMCNSDRYMREYQDSHVLNLPVYIFFNHELRDAKTEKEIRVMVKDNKIQGISSYKVNGASKYSSEFIPRAIEFLNSKVLPFTTSWQQNVVIDILERNNKDLQIIEFNPYYASMPCYYGYHKNIGKPFIIESDIYNIQKRVQEVMMQPIKLLTR